MLKVQSMGLYACCLCRLLPSTGLLTLPSSILKQADMLTHEESDNVVVVEEEEEDEREEPEKEDAPTPTTCAVGKHPLEHVLDQVSR